MQQLNLVGIIFSINDSAHQRWKSYRMGLYRYFVAQPDGEEILADIEHHIAEIFWETTQNNTTSINDFMVLSMIARVGNVADFMEVEVQEPYTIALEAMLPMPTASHVAMREKEKQALPKRTRMSFAPYTDEVWELTAYRSIITEEDAENARRERADLNREGLCRDTKRSMIGGVAAGLAHYFHFDVVWVRLVFLALGSGLVLGNIGEGLLPVLYAILWVVLPTNPHLPDSPIHYRLYRDLDDAQIGGVCAGIARYFGWDKKRVRNAFVLSAFTGVGLIAYPMFWFVMPKKKSNKSFLDELKATNFAP